MSLPEIRKVKHLHQLQADTENPFNNSLENAICLIHFSTNQKTSILSYIYRWCYSSRFKLFSPHFRPNACINKFNLLYCFIPLALPMEISKISSTFEWLLDIIYLIQNEHWMNWQINQQIILLPLNRFKLLHVKLYLIVIQLWSLAKCTKPTKCTKHQGWSL